MGVRRAVDAAKKTFGEGVYILGEIIHNESVTNEIKKLGTRIIESPDEIDGGTVIIRSHGVGKDVYDKLKSKNVEIIDCTCPFVLKIHNIVQKYHSLGYRIFITGEKDHPEVEGINGWCENSAIVIDEDYENVEPGVDDRICLVSQTTYSETRFKKILEFFSKKTVKTLEVFKTICYTTRERQEDRKSVV